MTVPFTPPADSLLVSGLDDYPAAIGHLVGRGVENLTCISLPAIHNELLAEWCDAGGTFDAIDLIQLDDRDRGPSPEQPSLVRPVPLSRLHELVEIVDAGPFASGTDHTVVLLGIPALFDAVGISRTRATVWSLLDALDGVCTVVLVTLSSTPDAVPAGFTHLFANLREPVGAADTAQPLQPIARFDALTTDRIFELIGLDRRRELLRTLDGDTGSVHLADLAIALTTGPLATSLDHEELQTVLFQVDLPTLDAADVVSFDRSNRTAAIRPEAVQLWPFLELADRTGGI